MDFRHLTASVPNIGYYGLSAIPIDGQTFQLVNLTPSHNSSSYQNAALSTPPNPPRSRLFSDTFLAMLSASMDSPTDASTASDLSSLTDPFMSPASSSNHSTMSTNSTFDGSFIAESRPLPDSFSFPDTFGTRSTRNASSILSSVPHNSPLSNHPYFTALCDVLRTDLELKKMVSKKPNIDAMERELYDQLQILEVMNPYQVSTIRTFYKSQSSSTELERFNALSMHSSDTYYSDLLNSHYDDQRVQIINRVNQSVELLRQSLMNSQIPKAINQVMAFEATTTPCTSTPFKMCPPTSISNPPLCTTPVQSPPSSQCFEVVSSPGLFNLIQAAQSPDSRPPATSSPVPGKLISSSCSSTTKPTTSSTVPRSRPVLSKSSIQKLEAWYIAHEEHPYPNNEVTEDLANACNISYSQVRKWFANKRNRSKNTKTLAAIACRKRQEKYGFLM